MGLQTAHGVPMQELGCSSDRMSKLIARALPRKDALAFKVVRNLSQHGGAQVQDLFAPYIADIIAFVLVGLKKCRSSV